MKPLFFQATATAALLVFGFAATAVAQDAPYQMILTQGNLDALVDGTLLKSPVPPDKQNVISEIQIGFKDTEGATPVELNVDVVMNGGRATVLVDDALLAKIKGQPVRFDVNGRPLNTVMLKYDAPVTDPMLNQAGGEGIVFLRIGDSKRMAGKLNAFEQISLKTAFGDVTIPMSEVAGVKFHTTADDKAVVVLINGDSVTGIPSLPAIQLSTDWGRADIDPEFIQSLTSASGARFRQVNSDFGIRWVLQTGNAFAPPALGN